MVTLALMFGLGALVSQAWVKLAPEVQAAIARQERARAAQLEAQAAEAQTRAEAAQKAQSAIVYFWQWTYTGLGAGLLILFIGAAVVGVHWLNLRAQLVYSQHGQAPLVMRSINGQFVIMDAARSLTGITTAAELPPPTEQAQIQIATQAQATAALVAIAGKTAGDDVSKRMTDAAKVLPMPTFAAEQSGDNVRMVYVKLGNGSSEAQRDLQDLREFITGASVRGLARRAWMGHHFASGHDCTRARYDALIMQCQKANVIANAGNGWALTVAEAEALDAFGVGDKDATPTTE